MSFFWYCAQSLVLIVAGLWVGRIVVVRATRLRWVIRPILGVSVLLATFPHSCGGVAVGRPIQRCSSAIASYRFQAQSWMPAPSLIAEATMVVAALLSVVGALVTLRGLWPEVLSRMPWTHPE